MWHWLLHLYYTVSGANNEAGPTYGSWSGIMGGLQVLEWLALGILVYYHHTCHWSPWCLRWAHHPLAGGTYKVCSKHHPDHKDGRRPRGERLHELHRAWEARQ
jgi:hypothetical protein